MSIGIVFPGQGSQSVGMLGDLAIEYSQIEERFGLAGESIGLDLWDIVKSGPEERLASTEITQPALLTASVVIYELLKSEGGINPAIMAGHSLGEYSALVCAESIGFIDAVRLVHQRGLLMKEAVPNGQGGMAAILGLDASLVEECCDRAEGVVSPANFNAPGQIVIAGTINAVKEAAELCKEAGARRSTILNVSGPFHSSLMEPARDDFAEFLGDTPLSMPSVPVAHNVDGSVAKSVDELKSKLIAQLSAPVCWEDCMAAIYQSEITNLIECGPGKVLTGLNKRINPSIACQNAGTVEGLRSIVDQLA